MLGLSQLIQNLLDAASIPLLMMLKYPVHANEFIKMRTT